MALPSAPFNTAKSLYAGLSVIALKLVNALTGVTAATDTVTKTDHGLSVGDVVKYVSGTGFTGLTVGGYYYVVAVPDDDTFKVSATPGGSALTPGTSTVGVFQPVVVFESRKVDSGLDQETKDILRPDARGVLRKVRTVTTSESESFTFEMDEAKRLLEIFDGALAGRVTGFCTMWTPDPDDDSGKVSLKSEDDFAVTVTRDGNMTFGDGDFTKPQIKIESNKQGAVSWTADVAV